jgi:hypothetical protein
MIDPGCHFGEAALCHIIAHWPEPLRVKTRSTRNLPSQIRKARGLVMVIPSVNSVPPGVALKIARLDRGYLAPGRASF